MYNSDNNKKKKKKYFIFTTRLRYIQFENLVYAETLARNKLTKSQRVQSAVVFQLFQFR